MLIDDCGSRILDDPIEIGWREGIAKAGEINEDHPHYYYQPPVKKLLDCFFATATRIIGGSCQNAPFGDVEKNPAVSRSKRLFLHAGRYCPEMTVV